MAGNWGAALAALAGGAGSLANSMDTRAQEAESKRQRQLAEALKMLEVKDIYGGTDVPEGTSPSDAMTGLAVTQLNRMAPPGIQQAGGGSSMMPQITSPSYTGQRDEQLSYGAPSVQDIGGKHILFDPSMGKEARTERRMLKIADTKDKALQSREAVKSVRDFAEAMELAKVQAGLKPDPEQSHKWRLEEMQAGRAMTPYQQALLSQGERRLAQSAKSGDGKLPAPAIEKMIDLDAIDSLAENTRLAILKASNAHRSVGGRALGVVPIPAWVRNNVTREGGEEGISARNLLGDLTSQIGNMRSGGAITPQEFNRLDQFLPNANDDESTMLIKLKNLRATFADIKRIRAENYRKYSGIGGRTVMTNSGDFGGVVLEPPPED